MTLHPKRQDRERTEASGAAGAPAAGTPRTWRRTPLASRLAALVVLMALASPGFAQDGSMDHAPATQVGDVQPTIDQLRALRAVLAQYEDVEAALADGFERFGECMSNAQGGQGIHFTNGTRIEDPALDPLAPEVLMYEERADGSLRLIGAEFLVFQQAWHDGGTAASPALLGREFYLNTTLLDEPFYALHVWVWQQNPLGMFANWNPLVGCGTAAAEAN